MGTVIAAAGISAGNACTLTYSTRKSSVVLVVVVTVVNVVVVVVVVVFVTVV